MARTAAQREKLKQWAATWRPQPRHGRLNRYARLKGRWSEYHKSRVVLTLTPAQLQKAESIYYHLRKMHREKVGANPRYCRILWACAVSRCRKNKPQRYEHLSVVKRLDYWFDVWVREGCSPPTPPIEERRSRPTQPSTAESSHLDELISAIEQMTLVRP